MPVQVVVRVEYLIHTIVIVRSVQWLSHSSVSVSCHEGPHPFPCHPPPRGHPAAKDLSAPSTGLRQTVERLWPVEALCQRRLGDPSLPGALWAVDDRGRGAVLLDDYWAQRSVVDFAIVTCSPLYPLGMIREPAESTGSGRRMKGREAIVPRYGTQRSFMLRTLYSWLTMSMLYLFAWPLAVIYLGAPGVAPHETSADWYQIRLLAPVLIAALAAWLWQLSPAPAETMARGRALALFRQGRIWPQALLFLIATPLVLTGFLMVNDPAGAIKLVLLTLAESLAIQILTSGYLHAAFDIVLEDGRANLAAIGLYAAAFAIRASMVVAAEQAEAGGDYTLAIVAGVFVGIIVGGVSSWLRARSGSLLPGVLALWLTFLLLGLGDFYE